jgi:hypothetical protein
MAYLFVMYGGIPDTELFSAAYDGKLDRTSGGQRLRIVDRHAEQVDQTAPTASERAA